MYDSFYLASLGPCLCHGLLRHLNKTEPFLNAISNAFSVISDTAKAKAKL